MIHLLIVLYIIFLRTHYFFTRLEARFYCMIYKGFRMESFLLDMFRELYWQVRLKDIL